jgi:uncharacterized membrane protein
MRATEPSTNRRSRSLRVTIGVLIVIGVAAAIRRTILLAPSLFAGGTPPDPSTGNPLATDGVFADHPLMTLAHILPGLLFLLLAPIQFSQRIRASAPGWHRWNGRLLVAAGAVVGISALDMAFRIPIGGANQTTATAVFGVFFLTALGKGIAHIRRGDVARHREWMIRAFATALAIATIRPIVAAFFATSRLTGLAPKEIFGIAFWLGFTAHLIAAEAFIDRARRIANPGSPG